MIQDKLKSCRLASGLTQKNVADYLGIAEVSYQRYELGTREPKLSIVVKIAECFNVSIDYLVGRTDNPEINR